VGLSVFSISIFATPALCLSGVVTAIGATTSEDSGWHTSAYVTGGLNAAWSTTLIVTAVASSGSEPTLLAGMGAAHLGVAALDFTAAIVSPTVAASDGTRRVWLAPSTADGRGPSGAIAGVSGSF
jgi:hypothetical protein